MKWIRPLVIGASVSVLALMIVPLCIPVVAVTQASCDQIRPRMTVREAAAIIGGEPGSYDGIEGWSNGGIPPYRKDDPTWVALSGTIVLYVGDDGKVIKANYSRVNDPDVLVAEFAWERLTRNVDWPRPRFLINYLCWGVFSGLLVGGTFALSAVFQWRRSGQRSFFYICILGVIVSAVVFVIDVAALAQGAETELAFAMLGASASALICCLVGSAFTDGRQPLARQGFVAEKCA